MELTFGLYNNHQCITTDEIIKKMFLLKNFDIVCFFNVSHMSIKKMANILKKEYIYNDDIGIIYSNQLSNIIILKHNDIKKNSRLLIHKNEDDMTSKIHKIFSKKYLDHDEKEEHHENECKNNELWFTFDIKLENEKCKKKTNMIKKPIMTFIIGCIKKYCELDVQQMLSHFHDNNNNIILISNTITCYYEKHGKMNILHNILGKIDIDERYYDKKYEICSHQYIEFINLLKIAENESIEDILHGKTNLCKENKELHYKLIYPLNETNIHNEFYRRINEIRNKYLKNIPELNHILVNNNLYEKIETLEICQPEKKSNRNEYSCYISSLNKYAENICNSKNRCICNKKHNENIECDNKHDNKCNKKHNENIECDNKHDNKCNKKHNENIECDNKHDNKCNKKHNENIECDKHDNNKCNRYNEDDDDNENDKILHGKILYFKICLKHINEYEKIEQCYKMDSKSESDGSGSSSGDGDSEKISDELYEHNEHHKHNGQKKHKHGHNKHDEYEGHECEIHDNSILTNMIVDHSITEKKIESGSITSDKIKANAIKNVHLSENIISGKNIINKSIDTVHLVDKCITNKKMAPNSISKSNIISNSISTDKIEDKSITSTKICDNSITTGKLSEEIISILNRADDLCNDLIDSDKLAPNSITNEKIENNSITHEKLTDNCIRRKNIEDFSISHKKLAIDSVDTCNIVDGSILHEKLSDECVKTANIVDGAITHIKLDDECIKSANLVDGSVIHKKLSNDCIRTANITNSSITHEKLSENCVKNANIVDGTISHQKLADYVIHTANLNDNCVTCEKLSHDVMHLIHEGHLRDDIIVSDYLSPGCVTHDKLSEYCINTLNIMDNCITFNKLENSVVNRLDQVYDIQQFVNEPITHDRLADYCIHNNNLSAGCILKNALSQEVIDIIGNTNKNTAFYLNTSTGVVNISGIAPLLNQSLIAISPTIATWQTISHLNLSNIGINTHHEIDEFITETRHNIANLNECITTSTTISANINNINSLTTTINIGSSPAPLINQCLIADSSIAASWKTIDHYHLSNIGINTHHQIDTFIDQINIFVNQINNFKTNTQYALDNLVTITSGISLNGTQTLTNKTIVDHSNTIAADFLHTNNGSVNISNNSPSINQSLVATNNSNAHWQYINHDNLLNIGTNSHAELDAFIIETRNTLNNLVTISSGVSLNGSQILTNKTLNDRSNIISSSELFSNTSIINISNSNAPSIYQVLTAISETEAQWETIDHNNLLSIGQYSHNDIDLFIMTINETLNNISINQITENSSQILTNKTLIDPSNIISSNYLFCNNGSNKINIYEVAAPFQYQVLMASDASNASWETINHNNISNIGIHTHDEIDAFINSTQELIE